MAKERLDVLLVKRGLAPSREKAKALIMAGTVFVDGQKEDKAGQQFDEEALVTVKGDKMPFVSRGGFKLAKAFECFDIDIADKVCMDIGASTGGFTDCMLQNGASKVYSVDVGHGQLDWGLRNDPRVVCMERFNIRFIKPEDVGEKIDFASADVSFISLTKILIPVREIMSKEAFMVCLIKPQFEAGRSQVGKHGVVRDKKVHISVIKMITEFVSENGFLPLGLSYSPIKGPEGNIEYLLYMKVTGEEEAAETLPPFDVESIVESAHSELG